MAAELQKLRFSVISAAIFCLVLHQVIATSEETQKCNTTVAALNKCWEWHHMLPPASCTNATTTSLVRCVEIEVYKLQECDYHYRWEGQHRQKLYTTATELVCYNNTMHQIFEKDANCWREARKCALPIINLPKELTEEACQNVSVLVQECKSEEHLKLLSPRCSKALNSYVDRLLENSHMCGACALIVHLSLIFTAILLSFSTT